MKKNIIILTLTIAFSIVIVNVTYGQVPPPGAGPGSVPIDGGVFSLIAASVAYGIKRLRDKNKENITE